MATSQLSLFALADSAAVPEGTGILRKPRRTAAAEALRLPAHELDAVAQQWEEDAHAARTKKAYRADLAAFQAWCAVHGEGALPASTETLRRYLMSLALRGLRPSTIRRARKSIGLAHAHAALPRPDRDGRVRSLEYSIGRKLGAREEG
ncbi:MAG: integrase, partial [Myxococcaceae bacterium]|nr:integrase [Myxococcaceae bacterium]